MSNSPPSREALFAQPATILLIDDNPQDRVLVERELQRKFTRVTCKHIGEPHELEEALAQTPYDVAITDYRLQWTDGLTVLKRLKARAPHRPVIMFTGSGTEEIAVEAMKEGVDDYLTKLQKNYALVPYSVVSCLERIWERRQLEVTLSRLRESERRFRRMAEAMPHIVLTIDAQGCVNYVNDNMRAYTGAVHVDNSTLAAILDPDDREEVYKAWKQAVARHESVQIEQRIRSKDGGYRWFLSRATALFNEHQEFTGWVCTMTDIDDQKRAAEALRVADRRKDEFIATLAHELRNPLAPIRSALQFLQLKREGDAETRQARDIIERQLKHMIHLVDDLLEVSRITAGKIQLRKERANVYQLVLASVETVRPLIENAGHTLTITNASEPIAVEVDATRLTQVFGNILSNAAKYTPAGGRIEIHVARERDWAVIFIRDTGEGVPREMLGHIFDLFAQVHPDHSNQEGLGIGLALAKRLVELHGGTIAANSEGVGRGTEFVVRLPCATAEPIAAAADEVSLQTPYAPTARKVLVVDDNRDAADSLTMLLEMADCDVRKCYDGSTGLELAREFKPDVILLDVGMPPPDGLEVCRRLRQEPWGKDVVVSALTGWGQDEDRRRTLEAGFDEHLVKPVDMDVILHLLTRHGTGQRAVSG